MKLITILIFPLILTACAGPRPFSQKAMSIQVHTQMSTILNDCKKLGPVSATGWDTFYGGPWARRQAENVLRELAADRGADTVVRLNEDWNGSTHVTVHGMAFKCQ